MGKKRRRNQPRTKLSEKKFCIWTLKLWEHLLKLMIIAEKILFEIAKTFTYQVKDLQIIILNASESLNPW